MLILFAWPTARIEPRDLPIGVAGPPAAAGAVEQRLASRDGAFDVHRYADAASARRAIQDRDVYGAFVVGPGGATVLTASGGSQAVAQLLERAAAELGRRGGATQAPRVVDVVPATKGGALASAVLPLVLAGILTGFVVSQMAVGPLGRAGLLVAASALCGLMAALIVQSWLEVVSGSWLATAGALG